MRVIFNLIIILAALLIIFSFIFAFGPYKNRERFKRLMKKKATWVIMLLILLAPFLWYANYTMVLMLIRGDCFPAYHTYIEENQYIYYEDAYYVSITDDEEKCNIAREYVQGNWIEKGYVRWKKMQLPYMHYWVPGLFLEELAASDNNEYLYTHQWAGKTSFNEIYQRVEE